MNKKIQIAPSILSADFSNLKSAIEICMNGAADRIHIDIMDGHFVPNLTIGPVVVKWLRPHTNLPLDVHLMVTNPLDLVEPFAAAGADYLTFHIEASNQPLKIIEKINSYEVKAGLSLKPATPIEALSDFLEFIDLVLIMTVEPGFGGQDFLPGSTQKINELNDILLRKKLRKQIAIEVDGGINTSTAPEVVEAGADILVAGSAIFKAPDPIQAIRDLRSVRTS
jgi:ribulose-phosphate 3-epimerase